MKNIPHLYEICVIETLNQDYVEKKEAHDESLFIKQLIPKTFLLEEKVKERIGKIINFWCDFSADITELLEKYPTISNPDFRQICYEKFFNPEKYYLLNKVPKKITLKDQCFIKSFLHAHEKKVLIQWENELPLLYDEKKKK